MCFYVSKQKFKRAGNSSSHPILHGFYIDFQFFTLTLKSIFLNVVYQKLFSIIKEKL